MRQFLLRIITLLGTTAALAGCAATHTVGYVDPVYQGNQYGWFLSYAAFKDTALEAHYERAVCNRLRATGHTCTTMLEVLPPTRPESAQRRHQVSRQSSAGATIEIELAPHAQSSAVRQLGTNAQRFRITVFDNSTEAVAARFAITVPTHTATNARAIRMALASKLVNGLENKGLLASGR